MNQPDTGKTVYYTLDLNAPLSPETKAALAALDDRPIDLSDIPEQHIDDTWYMPNWPARFAARAARGEHVVDSVQDTVTS